MLYIDTSVLLVYTLTQGVEGTRYQYTEKLFARIIDGSLSGATSFYALHEVYVFALDNAPDFSTGVSFGKAALEKILALPSRFFPLYLVWNACGTRDDSLSCETQAMYRTPSLLPFTV